MRPLAGTLSERIFPDVGYGTDSILVSPIAPGRAKV
jgi:hypothetical protein